MAKRRSATTRVTGILLALLLASIALLPANVLAGSTGNVSVSGSGTTVSGGTNFVNGGGSTQTNVGGAQTAGQGAVHANTSACNAGPLSPAVPGSASAGTVSGPTGGSASAGTASGGIVIGGNAVGGNATGGDAIGGNVTGANATGGSAIGGSAIGGSAIGSTSSSCPSTTSPGGVAPLNQSSDNAIVCGTVERYVGAALTISTLTDLVNLDIPTETSIVGTIPASGNVCLLLTTANGVLLAIHVLTCHGSTSGTVKLPATAADTSALPLGGNDCGQSSLHTNTETSSNGSSSMVQISIDCPDPCAPTPAGVSASGAAPLPTPTTLPPASTGLPVVPPTGSSNATSANSPAIVTLQLADLPSGFQQTTFASLDNTQVAQSWHTTLAAVESSGHVAAFESAFRGAGNLAIGDRVDVYRSVSLAHLSFAATARTMVGSLQVRHAHLVKPVSVGKESVEFTATTGPSTTRTTTIELFFRRGRYLATITISGLPSLATLQRARGFAQILDTHLHSLR